MVKKPFLKCDELDMNAEEPFGRKAKLSFSQHAHDLMETLNRDLPDGVPVILCAHSVGGVLAKRVSKPFCRSFLDIAPVVLL